MLPMQRVFLSLFAIIFYSSCTYASSSYNVSKGESGFPDNYHVKELYQSNDNVAGSITVVDFSDYFCLPCRQITLALENLTKKDKNLRVVYVDYPLLGEPSIFAARAALAAKYQGKYLALHNAMMNAKKPLTSEYIYY